MTARAVGVDRGATAVAAAELVAFGGTDLEEPRPLAELASGAAAVTGGAWWAAAGGPAVVVGRGRAGSCSSRAVLGRVGPVVVVDVRLAPAQQHRATLAHELAHALAGLAAGHGPQFRAAQVDVVAVLAGAGPAAHLRAAYADAGLPIGRRSWPSPSRARGDGFLIVP